MRWGPASVKEACKSTHISTFAEFFAQVKTGFSSCLPYSRWCRPPAVKLGEPTSVTRESDISCSVRVSSADEEAGTRDGDAHLLRGGFIIEPQGASWCRGSFSHGCKSVLDSRRRNRQNIQRASAWGRSSAGRALPSQGRGRGFESPRLHHDRSGPDALGVRAFSLLPSRATLHSVAAISSRLVFAPRPGNRACGA